MIHGVGVDIVQLARIRHALETYGERFLQRIYTPREIEHCEAAPDERIERYAARFAAKEAAFKAFRDAPAPEDAPPDATAPLDAPHGELGWQDLEVETDASGAARLVLSARAAEISSGLGVTRIHLSLSHTGVSASAIVVAEK
jgi:holo-[acyl-carrier protein] synthase